MYLINLAGLARDLRDRQVPKLDFYGYLLGFLGLNIILPVTYAWLIIKKVIPALIAQYGVEHAGVLVVVVPKIIICLHVFIVSALILALIFYFVNRPKTVSDFCTKFIPLCLLQQLNLLTNLTLSYLVLSQAVRWVVSDPLAAQEPLWVWLGFATLLLAGLSVWRFVVCARLSGR